ncbi:hypothetical protein E3N88_32676 [Mikania micrantha]|uniref:Uncharacterized protein n=1 Tax=Mikania micrantha TaxID=192012 RepID=A0A5N6M9Q8_9ASTR|nr:hypothetical protein E3N88_32676 [Mikania micrantha]
MDGLVSFGVENLAKACKSGNSLEKEHRRVTRGPPTHLSRYVRTWSTSRVNIPARIARVPSHGVTIRDALLDEFKAFQALEIRFLAPFLLFYSIGPPFSYTVATQDERRSGAELWIVELHGKIGTRQSSLQPAKSFSVINISIFSIRSRKRAPGSTKTDLRTKKAKFWIFELFAYREDILKPCRPSWYATQWKTQKIEFDQLKTAAKVFLGHDRIGETAGTTRKAILRFGRLRIED